MIIKDKNSKMEEALNYLDSANQAQNIVRLYYEYQLLCISIIMYINYYYYYSFNTSIIFFNNRYQ